MSYIGNQIQNQNYVPAVDFFSGNGSTTAFTLSRPVASVAAVQAVISNVPQNPGSAFTVSGNTITFTSAPPSGTNNIYVYYTSPNTQVVQPGQGTVGATQVDGNYALWNKSGSDVNYTAGNVGIGTSSPAGKLDVRGSSVASYLIDTTSGSAVSSALYLGVPSTTTYAGLITDYPNDKLYFRHNSATRMTIDSSGNVGIGTSSPASFGSTTRSIDIRGSAGGALSFGNATDFGEIYATSTSTVIGSATAKPLVLVTGDTERMRIDSSGILLVNTTSYGDNGGRLQLGGDSTTMRFLPRTDNTGYIGQSTYRWAAIYAANGTIQTSDGREKNSVENSSLGLNFVNSLRPVSYKWNVGENVVTYDEDGKEIVTPRAGKRTHFGFIAQEVKNVLGEQDFGGYVEAPDGKLGLRYDQFIAPLVKAIQELKAEVDDLKAQLEAK